MLDRKQPVLLRLVVVELGEHQLRSALVRRIFSKGVELFFKLPLLRLVEHAAVVDAVLDAFHLLFRIHREQLVDADTEVHGDLRQKLHVRHARAAFPLADALRGDVQRVRQRFLCKPSVHSQTPDFFSHFHVFVLLFLMDSS